MQPKKKKFVEEQLKIVVVVPQQPQWLFLLIQWPEWWELQASLQWGTAEWAWKAPARFQTSLPPQAEQP